MGKKKSRGAAKSANLQHPRKRPQRPQFEISGANAEPVRSRLDRLRSIKQYAEVDEVKEDERAVGSALPEFLAGHFSQIIEDSSQSKDLPLPPPPPLSPHLGHNSIEELDINPSQNVLDHQQEEQQHNDTVTDGCKTGSGPGSGEQIAQETLMMNANGTLPSHRPQQPHAHTPRDKASHGIDIVSPSNRPTNGPVPSHIQVAKPFVFQQAIEACLHDLGVTQAREDNIRLAGVQWIDNTRRALKLPIKTFDTAVVYYHKFRLSHADNEYSFVEAAAASLFAACKIEDTLKKSRDILCAAHNAKIGSRADHLSPDDPLFEHQSRNIIGLERLMLEASSFDFRNRHPQPLIVKIARRHGFERHSAVTKTAYQISLDLYRTFAPLKQSTSTMAFACLELSCRLHGQEKAIIMDGKDYIRWGIDRSMVMETLLDLLELYTNYRTQTTVAPEFDAETILNIQISLRHELTSNHLPRFTNYIDTKASTTTTAGYAGAAAHTSTTTTTSPSTTNGTNRSAPPPPRMNSHLPQLMNGSLKASPTSPANASPGTPGIRQRAGERGKEGTVRFMLNPDRERAEKEVTRIYMPLLASMRR
ncbi:RNA polymerase II C-terminal domain kinase beta subunit [Lithohypha guttulata]|uniref:RNA polymerase II C-terminal domain kinase beta subunit n=1 Tax=Lithohypha guttulata TaxID=1690604 RepID=UPI002DE0761B|nr:RNA polymerase II C-terminal domain kinase beta subunit [Lithohypha guttulata]